MRAYTANAEIFVPEVRITPAGYMPGYTFVALRGYGYVVAVLDLSARCLGYADCVDFGYETALKMCEAQP